MNLLGRCISIAAQAFEGVEDKGGEPYILHCLRVMNAVKDEDVFTQCAAVLHDIVEDTEWTIEKLYLEGFPAGIVNTVGMLTHEKGVPYDDYIKAISTHPRARIIKMADLRDNSDITRLKGLTSRDLKRMEKYHRAYTYLKKI